MKKIVWVDDDIFTGALRAFVDEFNDNGINIEAVSNPDTFLESLHKNDFDCLIMDIMMPRGEKLSSAETLGGIHTGLKLLDEYLKVQYSKPIVIFTILNDETVKIWAQEHNVPYKLKQNEVPETFFEFITSL
jgi:CheY-like chemotaxis protein